jgi:putative ABC transport system permease protein
VGPDLRLVLGLAVLLGLGTGVLALARVRMRRQVLVASLRAVVQLALVGAVLGAVFRYPLASAGVLAVMVTAASVTAAGRLRALEGAGRSVVLAVLAGSVPTLAVVFASGAQPLTARNAVATGGIVIGGTMTASILAGRNLLTGLRTRRDEAEGWLALGATPRRATADIVRAATGEALQPAIAQTSTVGLVTLPGAFVGALAGGASPGQAARFQLTVLVALLCAEALAATSLGWLLGAPRRLPAADDAAGGRAPRRGGRARGR